MGRLAGLLSGLMTVFAMKFQAKSRLANTMPFAFKQHRRNLWQSGSFAMEAYESGPDGQVKTVCVDPTNLSVTVRDQNTDNYWCYDDVTGIESRTGFEFALDWEIPASPCPGLPEQAPGIEWGSAARLRSYPTTPKTVVIRWTGAGTRRERFLHVESDGTQTCLRSNTMKGDSERVRFTMEPEPDNPTSGIYTFKDHNGNYLLQSGYKVCTDAGPPAADEYKFRLTFRESSNHTAVLTSVKQSKIFISGIESTGTSNWDVMHDRHTMLVLYDWDLMPQTDWWPDTVDGHEYDKICYVVEYAKVKDWPLSQWQYCGNTPCKVYFKNIYNGLFLGVTSSGNLEASFTFRSNVTAFILDATAASTKSKNTVEQYTMKHFATGISIAEDTATGGMSAPIPTPSAVGDPHCRSADGEQFDIRSVGKETLLKIPRAGPQQGSMLTLIALISPIRNVFCAATVIKELNISGDIVPSKHLNVVPGESSTPIINSHSGSIVENLQNTQLMRCWLDTHGRKHCKIVIKLENGIRLNVLQRSGRVSGESYLNLAVDGLSYKIGHDVGGLLGYDSHTAAEMPPTGCEQTRPSIVLDRAGVGDDGIELSEVFLRSSDV